VDAGGLTKSKIFIAASAPPTSGGADAPTHPSEFDLLPGVAEAVMTLNRFRIPANR